MEMMEQPIPRRALALSGGASFGAYQAGVLAALEQSEWQPHVAMGISIGAVNGWLLARGVSASEMRELWLELPGRIKLENARFSLPWRAQAPLFRAWLDVVYHAFAKRPPRFEMETILLEAPSWRAVRVPIHEAGRDHLLAACALPGVMSPVRIDGKTYLDHGPVRNMPLPELLESDPDDVIAVDLLAAHPLPTFKRARRAATAATNWLRRRPARQPLPAARTQIRVIGHPEPLGGVMESFRWTPEFAQRLYAKGLEDGLAAFTPAQPEQSAGFAA